MLSRANSVSWLGGETRDEDNSWNNNNNNNINNNDNNNVGVDEVGLNSFKSMIEIENEWYNNNSNNTTTNNNNNSMNFCTNNSNNNNQELTTENLLLNPTVIIDSSSSCSPSPSVFNPANLELSYLFQPKNNIFNTPLSQSCNLGNNNNGFFNDNNSLINNNIAGVLTGFSEFNGNNEMGTSNLGNNSHFSNTHLFNLTDNNPIFGSGSGLGSKFQGFEDGLTNSAVFVNRTSKLLKPLDNSPPVGGQPTLFQKRAALRKNFNNTDNNNNNSGLNIINSGLNSDEIEQENDKKRKFGNLGNLVDSLSFDGSSFNYDSDDFTENNNNNNNNNNNGNSEMMKDNNGVDGKGKKKGLPAKNLMAERRRRKKLNDRLYMLRSVVPKISKMDRASILGDAIEYLKELLQKINDLHNELESSPPASTLTQTTNFHPLTPTLPNLPSRIKEELCASSLPSPNGQPARIEVRLREGRAVNIHMFCGRRPGLLLSTMRALDGLGLDIQQAVISCFNGFAMDIFRAEQCKDGQDVHPEQIKALLLELATFNGANMLGNCNM